MKQIVVALALLAIPIVALGASTGINCLPGSLKARLAEVQRSIYSLPRREDQGNW